VSGSTFVGTGSPYAYDATTALRIGGRPDVQATQFMNGYIRNAFVVPDGVDQATIQRIVIAAQRAGWGF